MNLSTKYLGFELRTPLVPSSSPLTRTLDNIRRLEDAGASAIVLPSLFEEQIRTEEIVRQRKAGEEPGIFPKPLGFMETYEESMMRADEYLSLVIRARAAVNIPVIGSLNASSFGGWTTFSRQIEKAGAAALELNFYASPSDPDKSGAEIEEDYLTILAAVRGQVHFPVAVKLSPYFTNVGAFARLLEANGADALVLFNRFYQPDIDPESGRCEPNIALSTSHDARLPMRWIAMLRGRIAANLAASSGVHSGTDAIKLLMAGADVTMVCSVLIEQGIKYLSVIERDMARWLEEHGHDSVEEIKGNLSQQHCAEPAAFERAHYLRAMGKRPRFLLRRTKTTQPPSTS